jgi:hypothetical protein
LRDFDRMGGVFEIPWQRGDSQIMPAFEEPRAG